MGNAAQLWMWHPNQGVRVRTKPVIFRSSDSFREFVEAAKKLIPRGTAELSTTDGDALHPITDADEFLRTVGDNDPTTIYLRIVTDGEATITLRFRPVNTGVEPPAPVELYSVPPGGERAVFQNTVESLVDQYARPIKWYEHASKIPTVTRLPFDVERQNRIQRELSIRSGIIGACSGAVLGGAVTVILHFAFGV